MLSGHLDGVAMATPSKMAGSVVESAYLLFILLE